MAPPAPEVTEEQLDTARRMIKAGRATWADIGRAVGLSVERLRRHLDPDYRERRNGMSNASNARKRAGAERLAPVYHRPEPGRISVAEAQRVLLTVPPDTRTRVQKALGDPIPGRSALDRKRSLGLAD